MNQYIALIQKNPTTPISSSSWEKFFHTATKSGLFQGGSEISNPQVIGNSTNAISIDFLGGFMRFDSTDKSRVLELLEEHPVVIHGGTVYLCDMPRS